MDVSTDEQQCLDRVYEEIARSMEISQQSFAGRPGILSGVDLLNYLHFNDTIGRLIADCEVFPNM